MELIVQNRKARHEYYLEEKFEAGLVLLGPEVKACRAHQVSLVGAYVQFKKGEAWLVGASFTATKHTAAYKPDPGRDRKLLLKKQELHKLDIKITQRGYTLVPTQMYFSDKGKVKIEIRLATGKKAPDKRDTLKKRIMERDAEQAWKRSRG